jgi:glycosyltransferase involved in cell wall biosynthesis
MPKSSQEFRLEVLHVIGSMDPRIGGPADTVMRLAAMSPNIRGVCATLDAPDAPFLKQQQFETVGLGMAWREDWFRTRNPIHRYRYSPRFVPWLRKNLPRFDVVVIHGIWTYTSLGCLRVLSKSRVPYVVFTHGALDPWFARTYRLKHLAKCFFWLFFEGPLLKRANHVLFTCQEECLQARKQFPFQSYSERVVEYGIATPPAQTPQHTDAFLKSTNIIASQ